MFLISSRQGLEQGQVGDGDPPAGLQHASDLLPDLRLIRREVQHAVGDHDVHTGIGHGQVLDLAQAELDVIEARVLVGRQRCRGGPCSPCRASCPRRSPAPSGRPSGPAMKTSKPPPLPRSRTTSPAWSEARAVGFPQESPILAPSGRVASSASLYPTTRATCSAAPEPQHDAEPQVPPVFAILP